VKISPRDKIEIVLKEFHKAEMLKENCKKKLLAGVIGQVLANWPSTVKAILFSEF